MTSIEFAVQGLPVAKGSTRSFALKDKQGAYTGRTVTTSTAKDLAPWENLVRDRAAKAFEEAWAKDLAIDDNPFSDPVSVSLAFRLPKPKSAPKTRRTWPTHRPDLDKLVRAVLDAITHTIIHDDSQVVQLTASKDFGSPGVTVRVEEIKEAD